MIISDIARGIIIAVVAVLYWLGGLNVPLVVLAALAGGVGRVFFDVANQAFVPQLVDKEDIVRANAALQNTISTARVAGPSAAGVIVQAIGAPFALVLDGASYFLNVFALLGMKVDTPIASGPQLSMWRRIRSGMKVIGRNEYLPWLLAASAVSNFALMIIQAIVVVYEVGVLHFGAWAVGVVASCDAIGLLAGAAIAPRLIKDGLRGQAMIVSYVVIAASTALLPLAAGRWPVALALMAVGYFLWGGGIGVFNVANISFRHQITPPDMMATVMGAWRTVLFGALPIGALVGGLAGGLAGLRGALWLGVAGNVLAALILVISPIRRHLGRQGDLREDS
jgi:Na+/melibiose symporter-like transporter